MENSETFNSESPYTTATPTDFLRFEILDYRHQYINSENEMNRYTLLGQTKNKLLNAKCLATIKTIFSLIKLSIDKKEVTKIDDAIKKKDHPTAFELIEKQLYDKKLTKWDNRNTVGRYRVENWNGQKGF